MFVPASELERQMEHLARRRTVVPLETTLAPVRTPRPPVAITFDDAYRSFLETALPLIERLGLPVTLFVPSGRLGGRNSWDEGTSCDTALMAREEVAEAARRGVSIESHGHMHVDLVAAGPAAARGDLDASVAALTEITGARPRFLAYPWGRHDEAVRRVAAEAGFEAAFAVNVRADDPYGVERVQVEGGDSRAVFAAKSRGLYGRVRRLLR